MIFNVVLQRYNLYLFYSNLFFIFATIKPIKKIVIMAYKISEDCTACGTCVDECPVEAISPGDIYLIDPNICTDCGTCADVCPVSAISPM